MSHWLKLTGMLLVVFTVAIVAVHLRESSARGRCARIQLGMSAIEVQAVMGRNADRSFEPVPISGPVMGDLNELWFFDDDTQCVWVAYKKNRVIDKRLTLTPTGTAGPP